MKRPPSACTPQAEDSLIYEGLIACCTTCASRMLARKSKRGADLRAPKGVRLVWWGFRALKMPERTSSSPTLQRRLTGLRPYSWLLDKHWTDTGQTLDNYCANAVQRLCIWCASTGQRLDKYWTFTGQRLDIRPAF